jgi:hypothetical protein
MQNTIIFPLFYLPPISYFGHLKNAEHPVFLDNHEHFPKQTYRNRASIASPNGRLDLTIPVVKGAKNHTAVKDVRISNDNSWQRLHWLSLQNCYRSSAYFEYYEDDLSAFYNKTYSFLFDYNFELLNWLLKQLKMPLDIQLTNNYQIPQSETDFRLSLTKQRIPLVQTKPYFQVFSDRNEYLNNLSIVDLLFNQGPQAKTYF